MIEYIMGIAFTFMGGLALYISLSPDSVDTTTEGNPVIASVMCALFVIIGIALIIAGIHKSIKKRHIRKNGTKVQVRVIGYDKDPNLRINEKPAIILICEDHTGQRCWVRTESIKHSKWPIGWVVQVIRLEGEIMLDKKYRAHR